MVSVPQLPSPYQWTLNCVTQALQSLLIPDEHNTHQILQKKILDPIYFSTITTDSRNIQPGCLFVALKGTHYDGHAFLKTAIQQGARGVLCHPESDLPAEGHWYRFFVQDTLQAYRQLAFAWRCRFSIPIFVVAGSVGKTTTKELCAAIFQGKWNSVLKSEKSKNGWIGIPMTLLELRPHHEVAVIEVGIDTQGAMQQHMDLIQPTGVLLTQISPEHLESLFDLPTIAYEECLALSSVSKSGGLMAIACDNPWIWSHASQLFKAQTPTILFSLEKNSQEMSPEQTQPILFGKISPCKKNLIFTGHFLKSQTSQIPETEVLLPLPGKHNASNLLGAIALAVGVGCSVPEIQKGLKMFEKPEGRSDIQMLPGPLWVICDYYNAQPAAVDAGLDLLAEMAHQRSSWACLADMLELGPTSEALHRALAQKIIDLQIQHVFLFGTQMLALLDELQKQRWKNHFAHFNTHAQLTQALLEQLQPHSVILIKGSRDMQMGEVWKQLKMSRKS